MSPQPQLLHLDVEAISGICGSISIACWIVVFTPQIFENFRRSSADGLSLIFVIVWLLGDVFNILGAVLQGVLPTMTILAVYYTFADMILLGQCFYYRGFTLSDAPAKSAAPLVMRDEEATEESPLLSGNGLINVDGTLLSPATPLIPAPLAKDPPAAQNPKPASTLTSIVFNVTALLLVCAAGVFGWWLSVRHSRSACQSFDIYSHHGHHSVSEYMKAEEADISFDLWGQIFGYLCAVLYLGSRFPQLLLNYRRKSTEGVSMLFFLFACVGNLTYVLSIFAYEPACAKRDGAASPLRLVETLTGGTFCTEGEWSREYGRYILLNASWLAGSAGTLFLDMGIFVQFWIYRGREAGRVD